MVDPERLPSLAIAIAAGFAVGAVFFGGLWWTVRRLPHARRPLVLYFGSLAARMTVAAFAFGAILRFYNWPELVAALIAFVAARLALTWRLGPVGDTDDVAQRAS